MYVFLTKFTFVDRQANLRVAFINLKRRAFLSCVQIDDSEAMEYSIIGQTTCMGDHKVKRMPSNLPSLITSYKIDILRHFFTYYTLGTYTYTLPSSYSDDPFFQLL